MKPIGRRNYGSIPHLPNSRLGPGDHHCHAGQAVIMTEKTRDRHDVVHVFEKLDGTNVGIARVGSEIFALQRSGYVASTSPYEMHVLFADWVEVNKSFWRDVLADGERLVGEWLAQAHGTKYSLPKGPFVAFDLIEGDARAPIMDVIGMCSSFGIPTPRHVHSGAAIAVDEALAICGHGDHGCLDEPEGLVYRVERKGRFDFAAKYVKPGKIDGLYLPGVTGSISEVAVWNWHPKMRAEQTA